MDVKILGAGCSNCHQLQERTNQALLQLGSSDTAELVSDFMEIGRYGVMSIPALVVDEQVVMAGKVPDVDDLVSLLGSRQSSVISPQPEPGDS